MDGMGNEAHDKTHDKTHLPSIVIARAPGLPLPATRCVRTSLEVCRPQLGVCEVVCSVQSGHGKGEVGDGPWAWAWGARQSGNYSLESAGGSLGWCVEGKPGRAGWHHGIMASWHHNMACAAVAARKSKPTDGGPTPPPHTLFHPALGVEGARMQTIRSQVIKPSCEARTCRLHPPTRR